jgi:hypothetical protein
MGQHRIKNRGTSKWILEKDWFNLPAEDRNQLMILRLNRGLVKVRGKLPHEMPKPETASLAGEAGKLLQGTIGRAQKMLEEIG